MLRVIPFTDGFMIVDDEVGGCTVNVRFMNTLLQGSESGGDSGGASSTAVVDLEIKMEDLRQALRKAQVLMIMLFWFEVFLCEKLESSQLRLHCPFSLTGNGLAGKFLTCFYLYTVSNSSLLFSHGWPSQQC